MSAGLWEAAAKAYSPAEANRVVNWRWDDGVIEEMGRIATEIQDARKIRPGQCRYWTALWAKQVRSELDAPAVQVGGDLFAHSECVYRCPEDAEFVDPSSHEFVERWPGHSWLALGDLIADISLTVTTVTDENCQLALRRAVEEHFIKDGSVVRVLGLRTSECERKDLLYVPKGVFSDAAIDRHIEIGRPSDD